MIILLPKQTTKQQKQQKDNNNNTNNNSNNEALIHERQVGNGIKLLKVLKSSDMNKRNSKQRFLFYKLVS